MSKSPPKVAIVSLFRDSAQGEYIADYQRRVDGLEGADLRFYLGEGDSTDNTYQILDDWRNTDDRVSLIKADSHLPYFGSIVDDRRFQALGIAANAVLDQVANDKWADYVLWLESDLITGSDLVKSLLKTKKPVVAPMIWTWNESDLYRFYDCWAFRQQERDSFPSFPKGWYADNRPQKPYKLWSAGSVLLVKASYVYKGARFGDKAIVSFCRECVDLGAGIWCDPRVDVVHP